MREIIHFQEKLQKPLCYGGRSTNVTLKESEVTCKNCLDKLRLSIRKKFNASVDWDAVNKSLDAKLPAIKTALLEFGLAHPWCKFLYNVGNYPPHVLMVFWIPATDRRRKSVGFDTGHDSLRGDWVQIFIPNENETDQIATFVGQLADAHGLRPRRIHADSAALHYELKVNYQQMAVNAYEKCK